MTTGIACMHTVGAIGCNLENQSMNDETDCETKIIKILRTFQIQVPVIKG